MLLPASFIASQAHDDDSTENPISEAKIPRNLSFGNILKIDFGLHMCCHVADLSNITNWQHIFGGASMATNRQQMLPPPCFISQFLFVVPIVFRYC